MSKEGDRSGAVAPTANAENRQWRGLADLTPALRREMASILTPMITEHLEVCLKDVLAEWMLGHTQIEQKVDPKEWRID